MFRYNPHGGFWEERKVADLSLSEFLKAMGTPPSVPYDNWEETLKAFFSDPEIEEAVNKNLWKKVFFKFSENLGPMAIYLLHILYLMGIDVLPLMSNEDVISTFGLAPHNPSIYTIYKAYSDMFKKEK